jgi:hypothetical protein
VLIDPHQRGVGSVGMGRVSGERPEDRDCTQFSAQCLGQVNWEVALDRLRETR